MSHDLTLAQKAAWHLARTLMAPVILFQVNDEFGVLPAYELDGAETVSDSVLPWVAGFAAATDLFPALMRLEDPALMEPLAILFSHFDPDDLEDADELLAVIEELEPPKDLAEAVEDLVRSVLLIADVSRPVKTQVP